MTVRAAAVLIALACLCACNPRAQTTATPTPNPRPTSTSLSLRITGRGTAHQPVRFVAQQAKANRVQYDLLAASFESVGSQGNSRTSFKNVHVTFDGKDGSTLMAR